MGSSRRGLWVYCIRRTHARAPKSKVSGIQPGTKVYAVIWKDIEAVVSEVDLRQFGEKEILGKLEQDLKWTERSVKLHHNIIVKASDGETAIPLKFGTLFRTRRNLEVMLKKGYRKFKTLLDQLKGKEEWGVKVYLDRQKFIAELGEADKEIKQFEKKKEKAPEGIKWYADRKIDEVIRKKFGDAVEKYLSKIAQELEWQAEKVAINEPTPREVTGREMVLSSACLIKKETAGSFTPLEMRKGTTLKTKTKITEDVSFRTPMRTKSLMGFKGKMEKFFEDLVEIGFTAEITGPWPPYNFVHFGPRE